MDGPVFLNNRSSKLHRLATTDIESYDLVAAQVLYLERMSLSKLANLARIFIFLDANEQNRNKLLESKEQMTFYFCPANFPHSVTKSLNVNEKRQIILGIGVGGAYTICTYTYIYIDIHIYVNTES